MRFHMQPWNGTFTLLDVRSTSEGIPPRKTCCKLTGWSLGRDVSLLASSSTWTAKDLREQRATKSLPQIQIFTKTEFKEAWSVKLTCQGASRCAVCAPYRHWAGSAQVVWWHGEGCDCQWTPGPPGSLCSTWQRGRAVEGRTELHWQQNKSNHHI